MFETNFAVVSVSSRSLKAFGQNAVDVRNVVLRMALSDSGLSSTAVLRAAIALACLSREGPSPNAIKYKVAALRALSSTAEGGIDQPRSFQHIAAGMLLGSYEVYFFPFISRILFSLLFIILLISCY